MENNNNSASGGVGFAGLLTILFIALKLTHVIDWSWWWVLSPVWITAALVVVILVVIFVVAFMRTMKRNRHG